MSAVRFSEIVAGVKDIREIAIKKQIKDYESLTHLQQLEIVLTQKDWEYIYFAVEDRFIKELDNSPPEIIVRILTYLKAKVGS